MAYLHVAERALHPASRYVSEYVLTRSGWVMRAAFASMTFGGLSLALGLALIAGWPGIPLAGAVGAFAVSMGVAGWYPTDPSTSNLAATRSGTLHNRAALFVYRSIVAAALLGAVYGALEVAPFQRTDSIWFLSCGAVVLGYGLTNYGWRFLGPGIAQRIFLATVLVWLSLAALRVIDG